MELIFFSHIESIAGKKIVAELEKANHNSRRTIYQEIDSLSSHLRRPLLDGALVVAVVDGHRDLERLHSMALLLSFVKLVLVLPDDQEETVNKAHQLHPRFVSFADGNMAEVVSVISKMLLLHP